MTTETPTPEHDPMTPEQVYRHGLRLLLDKDIDGWVALWDDRGVFEFPFAPGGAPQRLVGRAAVAAYMAGYPDRLDIQDFPYVEIHRTTDPDTVVVEMRATGRVVATDEPYEMSYIAVVTVVAGRITRYRDYWNPLAVPAAPRG
ncbi:nuclear transport factor 2 family protein [Streptomyces sp. LP05-1]|uniref:Nuclear transport factor 2 family protein n=1 Tax=Streptomyces pyxinae TaxID=2970734 RepID=A0ABT2CK38_9ACTN|nr:nuclear transport factor 2 family protein [Streptomyces sp. LP05-1]MCS0637665.1 nuclear transport factor 2 family protein [Streptomyces sp. LP05-1]